MYLSQLVLNPRSRPVQTDLSNPYEMHRTLMKAFPAGLKGEERLLYRLETPSTPPPLVLLLQSRLAPDWSTLNKQDYLLQPAQVKEFTPAFTPGQVLRFRLVANPIKRSRDKTSGGFGKRVRLCRPEEQAAWLQQKEAPANGFRVLSVDITGLSDQVSYKKDEKGNRLKMTHYGVRYDGLLEVTSTEAFARGLSNGIGPAKGFGFGLLSLAPA